MKYFVVFSLLTFLALSVFAEEIYLRDVPEGHYAYDAVYDLIRRGVTGGYPDGTFRGKKFMNRYEIASFMSKLARSFDLRRGRDEKLVEELKSEVSLLQYQSDKGQLTGDFQARWRVGQTQNQRGARADYRLRAQVEKNFGETAHLKINLDTMDAGFGGGARDFLREILDLEGRARVGLVTLKATSGPGDITHLDDGLFPAENEMKYRRPWRTLSFSTNLGKMSLTVEYISRSTNSSGLIEVAEVSSKLSQDFSPLKLILNPRIFYNSSGERDARVELAGQVQPAGGLSFAVLLGAAKLTDYPHGLYLGGNLEIGGAFKITAQKIGAQYREKFSYSIFDAFDRNLSDGSSNLGIELVKKFDPSAAGWFVKVKADYTDPGEVETAEFHLGRDLTNTAVLELIYQAYKAQSFSQALGLQGSFGF